MILVILNLLIALMGDSYEKVQESAEVEFRRQRAQLLREYEFHMSAADRNNPKYFPRWLHVLKPKGADDEHGSYYPKSPHRVRFRRFPTSARKEGLAAAAGHQKFSKRTFPHEGPEPRAYRSVRAIAAALTISELCLRC